MGSAENMALLLVESYFPVNGNIFPEKGNLDFFGGKYPATTCSIVSVSLIQEKYESILFWRVYSRVRVFPLYCE